MFLQGIDGHCFDILVSLLYFDKLILIVFGYYSKWQNWPFVLYFYNHQNEVSHDRGTSSLLALPSTTHIWRVGGRGNSPPVKKYLLTKSIVAYFYDVYQCSFYNSESFPSCGWGGGVVMWHPVWWYTSEEYHQSS